MDRANQSWLKDGRSERVDREKDCAEHEEIMKELEGLLTRI